MIELDLKKLAAELIWELQALSGTRTMCVEHGIEHDWILAREGEVADLLGRLRRIMDLRGDVLLIRDKG